MTGYLIVTISDSRTFDDANMLKEQLASKLADVDVEIIVVAGATSAVYLPAVVTLEAEQA